MKRHFPLDLKPSNKSKFFDNSNTDLLPTQNPCEFRGKLEKLEADFSEIVDPQSSTDKFSEGPA